MDEAKLLMRIASQRGELPRVLQSKLRPEQAEAVEKLNGFGVGHGFTPANLIAVCGV
jgi:hypothetical protein